MSSQAAAIDSDYESASDTETLDDHFSPTDGYFERREHPREVIVNAPAGPSHEERQDNSMKAQEAAREREEERERQVRERRNSEHASLVPSSSRRQQSYVRPETQHWANEQTPLLDAGPPPPAYSDVFRTSPLTASGADGPTASEGRAGTSMAVVDAGRVPQSMRDDNDEEELYSDDRRGRHKRRRRYRFRRCCHIAMKLCLVLGLMALVTGLAIEAVETYWPDKHRSNPSPSHPPQPSSPSQPTPPPEPSQPPTPNPPEYPSDPGTFPFWPSQCGTKYNARHGWFLFADPEEFGFLEIIAPQIIAPDTDAALSPKLVEMFRLMGLGLPRNDLDFDGTDCRLDGRIYGKTTVKSAPSDQVERIVMNVTFATSEVIEIQQLQYTKSDNNLYIDAPRLRRTGATTDGIEPCMIIESTMFVKPGLTLRNLEIGSEHMDVHFEAGLDLKVTNMTDITLMKGSMSTPADHHPSLYGPDTFSSRKTEIELTAGSITGAYPLLDELSLKTKAGSIAVTVHPKDALPSDPQPATFRAFSNAGSILVNFPSTDLPDRDYQTNVQSYLSSITGHYILGSDLYVGASSGQISIHVLPFNASEPSTLTTSARSGSTTLKLLPSYHSPKALINNMTSTHHATAGSLSLIYPEPWTGFLSASTTAGSLSLDGWGVHIINAHGGPVGRYLEAYKRNQEGSKMTVRATAGAVRMKMGDLERGGHRWGDWDGDWGDWDKGWDKWRDWDGKVGDGLDGMIRDQWKEIEDEMDAE